MISAAQTRSYDTCLQVLTQLQCHPRYTCATADTDLAVTVGPAWSAVRDELHHGPGGSDTGPHAGTVCSLLHLLYFHRIVQDLLVAPQAAARPPQPRYPPATIREVGAGEDRVDRESGAGEMEVSEGEASSNPASRPSSASPDLVDHGLRRRKKQSAADLAFSSGGRR